jgi:transposase InsO family protein
MPWKKSSVAAQRRALVQALLAGRDSVAVSCQHFGVSRQTAYKFWRRFRALGAAGLRNRSRRPARRAALASRVWRRRLLRARRAHPTWGARKLRWLLQRRYGRACLPVERTLQRWIAQAGLTRVRAAPRRRARHARHAWAAQARRSNDVWTIDLKGWFRPRDGCKIEPLTIRDLWSRFLLCARPLAPRDEPGVRRICQRLFRRHGPPRVIRCDRGAPFFGDGPHGFTRLSLWWWRLGIRVEFVRRGAIHNNAHEQMHGVLKAEVAIQRTAAQQARSLARWRHRYNHQRPHEALGLRTPASCYRSQRTPLPAVPGWSYPVGWLVRCIQRNGETTLPQWRGTIGRAFGGLRVGFRPVGPRRYRVYFTSLYLGSLERTGAAKLLLAPC